MPDTTSAPTGGLSTKAGVAVPLTGVEITAELSGFCARVSVTQRYVNRESTPIEAVYTFPLDEGAAVSAFEALIDGTLVVGEIRERDAAFEAYDDAMARGDGAFLLDEERPDVFVASIGNLPAGKDVCVKLVYVTELTVDDGRLQFAIPTTVAPRYAPAADRVGVGRPDADTLNPPLQWQVPYGLNLTLRLAMPGLIAVVESPSHPIRVAQRGQDATVVLSQPDAALDRDFVLSVEVGGLDAPQAWVERDDDDHEAVAIGFYPRFADRAVPSELIFLVDRSGSMQGTSIEEVRRALHLCLRSMIPGCEFNICGFGSRFESLFPESRPYDDATLARASAHVTGVQADLGGTELLPALQFVLEGPRRPELRRQVIVLTDGEVSNTDAVLALAAQHAGDARVFTFGIGAGASRHLVRGLARVGGGSAEFVYPGERIEPKVMRQFARLLSPSLTDVRMDWGGAAVAQAPSRVPPIFTGGRLIVYGFLNGVRPDHVRLTATSSMGPVTFDVPIDASASRPGRTIATLAARARIRELEETPEWAMARGSRQARKESPATREIVALSLRYGVMSRETSFVAIERRETPVIGDVQLRRVPIALTHDWGGADWRGTNTRMIAMSAAPAAAMWSRGDDDESAFDRPMFSRVTGASIGRRISALFQNRAEATPAPAAAQAPQAGADGSARRRSNSELTRMHVLVAQQRADGSWDLTAELAGAIGRTLAELEVAGRADANSGHDARRAWATALAIVWLTERAPALEREWRALVRKARAWLDVTAAPQAGHATWIERATAFFASAAG